MLDRIRKLITDNSNRTTFFRIVEKRFPYGSQEFLLIESAYDTSKNAFRNEVREGSGERYFEHLRAVALILMEHLRVTDAEVIAAALLHDIVEDIEDWTQQRISSKFTPRVSHLVWWVTKPPVSDFDGDKEARNRAYHQNLRRSPRESLIIKLADRLHNLITLWGVEEMKALRKVRETQDFYLPLAEQEILLIHEIEDALDDVMSNKP